MFKIEWNAVSAIGQWVGAIGTLLAVIVALRQNKPNIKVIARRDGEYLCDSITLKPIEHRGRIVVTAWNLEAYPVEISFIGYEMPQGCYTTTKEETEKLPKYLTPGEHVSIEFDSKSIKNTPVEKLHAFYSSDGCGRVYYQEASFIIKICRFIWLKIWRYAPKYYKAYKRKFKEPK